MATLALLARIGGHVVDFNGTRVRLEGKHRQVAKREVSVAGRHDFDARRQVVLEKPRAVVDHEREEQLEVVALNAFVRDRIAPRVRPVGVERVIAAASEMGH